MGYQLPVSMSSHLPTHDDQSCTRTPPAASERRWRRAVLWCACAWRRSYHIIAGELGMGGNRVDGTPGRIRSARDDSVTSWAALLIAVHALDREGARLREATGTRVRGQSES